jgi:hypothetical protein
MIPSGLTYAVIQRASPGNGYVRVRDSGLLTAVAQFLYDEAALLDEWRLDEWLALFHREAARYLIPSPEDLSDDPATNTGSSRAAPRTHRGSSAGAAC